MAQTGNTSIASGRAALEDLLQEIRESELDWNEAETRFQIIDRIIVKCLGWPHELVRLEQGQDGRAYTDYELGMPRCAIWEAKRENRIFELPAGSTEGMVTDLPSIMALDSEASEAIKQVQRYCSSRGVELAVATNGHQLIAFLATRNDGLAPLEGRCLVIDGYEKLLEYFPKVWQSLSPLGVAERRLNRLLSVGEDEALPNKLSMLLPSNRKHRYPSDAQRNLRELGQLLLIDLVVDDDAEAQFYKQCYCESGALSQHALISKRMLAARYASLFEGADHPPKLTPVLSGRGRSNFTPQLMDAAISRRPIILTGDVGVGKTSFLKHLIHVSAFDEFKKAIYVYIDLGSHGALAKDLKSFVLDEIETQLRLQYGVDIYEGPFVRGVYNKDVIRFGSSIFGDLRESDPEKYREKLLEFLEEKIKQRDKHVRSSISHLAKARREQIIFVLDNADQRDSETQEQAFIIAQNLAKDWQAAVFVSVRPQTFYKSRQAGSLTAYPHRVFTIAPPRVDQVIEKRLVFAHNMAEGRIEIERLKNIDVRLPTIAIFLQALLYSLKKNTELVEFLSNITAGNIRAVVELVANFIGNPNVNAEKIIRIMERKGQYVIPVHEFWRATLLGEYSYYDPQSSLAANLFEIQSPVEGEHFLMPMVLGYLNHEGEHKTTEGFVLTTDIVAEMQEWGFLPNATKAALRRANNKRLVDTPHRITFDEDAGKLFGEMPEYFRISTIGAYHLQRWLSDFSYLDAMAYDTPVVDADIRGQLGQNIGSFAISDRLDRARKFRSYLTRVWHGSNLAPPYFDWTSMSKFGNRSFRRVAKAIKEDHV